MIWLVTLMLSGMAGEPPAPAHPASSSVLAARVVTVDAMLASESRRIRSTNKRMTKLLTDGVRRSRTFADLVSKIHQSNVIVYVEPSFDLPADMGGRILLQAVAGNQRYLRVHVRATLQSDHLIAVIAHELRHALEVADDPTVTDDAGLIALYRRIGHGSYDATGYDTEAARVIGKLVRDELIG